MLPSSVLLGQMIHQWTRIFDHGPDGWDISVGILVGVGIGVAADRFKESLLQRIPFYKLNAYFGNKLDETIIALRKRK